MSVSIYYTACRSYGLSEAERKAIEEVISRFSVKDQIEEYLISGHGWSGEDFFLYQEPLDSPQMIIDGATKLPNDSMDDLVSAVYHWCRALSEIHHLLTDADWHVHVDDHDIQWDKQRHVFDPSI
jgi:hypothetical protein